MDVRESHPSFGVIAIATEQGWIQGRSSTNEFNPGNNLTRGQMALILTRAYGLEQMILRKILQTYQAEILSNWKPFALVISRYYYGL
ncbi:hypothetical protein JCM19037_808 [Geomicrobium sp. JCM 19037]|uniref:S-layer homology domain-containing protein n=1 Tax=Geomicrobium sp. JCM 19037 TaxID=1460634 RepID=UPI00045F4697|nr:S-layer homology domain-containing protein [Geomicrobium sp. JCM 19037]GAK02565.1 hypothetical protein JCM19037_808 [Geomicrobium sp. JCM 19037]